MKSAEWGKTKEKLSERKVREFPVRYGALMKPEIDLWNQFKRTSSQLLQRIGTQRVDNLPQPPTLWGQANSSRSCLAWQLLPTVENPQIYNLNENPNQNQNQNSAWHLFIVIFTIVVAVVVVALRILLSCCLLEGLWLSSPHAF